MAASCSFVICTLDQSFQTLVYAMNIFRPVPTMLLPFLYTHSFSPLGIGLLVP